VVNFSYSEILLDHRKKLDFMRRGIITILFSIAIFFSSNDVTAQAKVIDSLLRVLEHSSEDSNKVNLLNDISLKYLNKEDYEQALKYGNASLLLAEKLGMKGKIALAYHRLGYINNEKGDNTESIKNYNAAVNIREEIGDKLGMASSLNNIANIYRGQGNYPEALKNHLTCLKIREEIGDRAGIATSLHNIGNIYRDKGNYAEALKNFFASLKIRQELGDKPAMVRSYYVIGNAYDFMGNYPEARKSLQAALDLCKETGNKKEIAMAYGNIGTMYNNQGNDSEALKNYLIAMHIFLEIGNKAELAVTYNNIGTVYSAQARDQSDSSKRKEYLNEALKYFALDLKLSEESADKIGIGFDHNNIGAAYVQLKQYDVALEHLFAGLKIRNEIGERRPIINSYITIGGAYYEMKKYSEARQFLNNALTLSLEAGLKDRTREIYKNLQKLDSASGQWTDAYRNYQLFISYKDSLSNEENAKKIVRLQMQYDFDKKEDSLKYEQTLVNEKLKQQTLLTQKEQQSLVLKEKELQLSGKEKELQHLAYLKAQSDLQIEQSHRQEKEKQLTLAEKENALQLSQLQLQKAQISLKENQIHEQRRQRYYYIGGIVLLFLALFFIVRDFRNRQRANAAIASQKLKTQKAEAIHRMAELELQSLRAQLNPHFMFNSLNAIQELVLMEDNEKSHIYLSAFADLLRMLLDNANQPFIPLKKEIQFLELYLSLENLRIPNLQYSIEVDEKIATNTVLIPNMILQPYIENAIWHGLSHKKDDRALDIRVRQDHGTILFQIKDNGVGRKKAEELKSLYRKKHRSKGMELLSKRFSLLSKEYSTDIQTTITDLYEHEQPLGTLVEIAIPLTLSEKSKEVVYDTDNHN